MLKINEENQKQVIYFLMGIKYLISLVIVFMSYGTLHSKGLVIFGILDLCLIYFFTDILISINKKLVVIANIFLLFFNLQYMVLYFSGSFITYVMVESLTSIDSLSGKAAIYIFALIALIVISFLPVKRINKWYMSGRNMLSVFLALELCLTLVKGNSYSFIYGYYSVWQQRNQQKELLAAINSAENITGNFYKSGILNCYTKPEGLVEQPNVILIFTEGLSQNIVTDERNIMPNLAQLENESLFIYNYYNHSYATYRALSGQLYSGYQLLDYDTNTLISIQDVLRGQGYTTKMICTEPYNSQFVNFLESMDFDEVIEDRSVIDGMANSLSDKTAYNLLYDTAVDLNKEEKPFFLSIYVYGTHVSFDSTDEKFGDGTNRLLNRFYNNDYQLGLFLDKFNNSDLADDTIIVFTADHGTYTDNDYCNTFPNIVREYAGLDQIPFCIYYKGMTPIQMDAQGRNSLDLAPTILDYLDISAPNYFLGETMFISKQNANNYDTVFYDSATTLSSDFCNIHELGDSETEIFNTKVSEYFTAKTQPIEE